MSKNEGVEYQDEFETYRFNVRLQDGVWLVVLPPGKVSTLPLTDGELARVLPAVQVFLGRIRWFGIFPRTYSVRFVDEPRDRDFGPYTIGWSRGRDAIEYTDPLTSGRFPVRSAHGIRTITLSLSLS